MSDFESQEPRFEREQEATRGLNLSALAVRERSVTLFFLLGMVIAGALAYFKLGRAEDPSFTGQVIYGDCGMAGLNCAGDARPGSGAA